VVPNRAMSVRPDTQQWLFDSPPHRVRPAPAQAEHVQLAARLPDNIRLGAMTWSYRGWIGSVYADGPSERELARHGLTAYVQHPLLSLAEFDRTYYAPLSAEELRGYAEQVPDDFRFLVKAHELCTVKRFPMHARYGDKRGQDNPLFLDASYAQQAVIEPVVEGLGTRLLALLWQFPPQDVREPSAFAHALHDFLRRLPKGVCYAIELRNPELLTAEYAAALSDTGAIHCHNAWTAMPSVLAQARALPASARRPLLIRWLLRPNETFEQARARYLPFDRLVAEDIVTRQQITRLVGKAHSHAVPSYVLVDNKAEGCAPETIVRLAHAIAEHLEGVDAR
jgi:uncharacterized protein YecE (DUF72 family)